MDRTLPADEENHGSRLFSAGAAVLANFGYWALSSKDPCEGCDDPAGYLFSTSLL